MMQYQLDILLMKRQKHSHIPAQVVIGFFLLQLQWPGQVVMEILSQGLLMMEVQ